MYGRAAHAVEVGAGVGAAEHAPGRPPRPRLRSAQLGVVAVGRDGPQDGAQVVVDARCRAACRTASCPRSAAMSPTTRPVRPSFAARVGVADDVVRRSRRAAGTRRPPRCRAALEHPRCVVGSRSFCDALGHGQAEDRRPSPGSGTARSTCRKLMFIGTSTGMVSATIAAAGLARRGRRPRAARRRARDSRSRR